MSHEQSLRNDTSILETDRLTVYSAYKIKNNPDWLIKWGDRRGNGIFPPKKQGERQKMSICEGCILFGRCDGNCGDTNPNYYAEQEENDYYDFDNGYPDVEGIED